MALLHPDTWSRRGQGRNLQFYCTDTELVGVLTETLPPELEPYSLVAVELVQQGAGYEENPQARLLEELPTLVNNGKNQFFLRSGTLTPALPVCRAAPIATVCAVNGLPIVHHGRVRKGMLSPSSIGIVSRVEHTSTGAVVHHDQYERIYTALHRALKKRLVHRGFRILKDGTHDLSRAPMLTEAIAAAYARGDVSLEFVPAPND